MCKASDTTLSLFPVLPRFIPVRIKHSDKLQSLNCQTHTHTQGQKEHPDQCAINYARLITLSMDHAPVQYSGHGALLFVVELQSDPLQTETTQSVNEEEPATRM